MNSPVLPRHPLDHDNVVKICLGQSASDALRALGAHCLVFASPADATAPEAAQGRMILLCVPITKELGDAAYQVASGKMRAVKPRSTPKSHTTKIHP